MSLHFKFRVRLFFSAIAASSNIRFEHAQSVWMALNDFRIAKPINKKAADFSDALIVNKAKFTASEQNLKLSGVYTFDIAAQHTRS